MGVCVYMWKRSLDLLVLTTVKIILIRLRQVQLAFDDGPAGKKSEEMQVDMQANPIHPLQMATHLHKMQELVVPLHQLPELVLPPHQMIKLALLIHQLPELIISLKLQLQRLAIPLNIQLKILPHHKHLNPNKLFHLSLHPLTIQGLQLTEGGWILSQISILDLTISLQLILSKKATLLYRCAQTCSTYIQQL